MDGILWISDEEILYDTKGSAAQQKLIYCSLAKRESRILEPKFEHKYLYYMTGYGTGKIEDDCFISSGIELSKAPFLLKVDIKNNVAEKIEELYVYDRFSVQMNRTFPYIGISPDRKRLVMTGYYLRSTCGIRTAIELFENY